MTREWPDCDQYVSKVYYGSSQLRLINSGVIRDLDQWAECVATRMKCDGGVFMRCGGSGEMRPAVK